MLEKRATQFTAWVHTSLLCEQANNKSINCIPIHEDELQKWNPLTEEIEIDFEKRESDAVIGYAAYFKLINGFRKNNVMDKGTNRKAQKEIQ